MPRCRDTFIAVFGFVTLANATAAQNAQRFFDWTAPLASLEEHRARRGGLMAALQSGGSGVLIVLSADGVTSGETFRQRDDFMYLTGLELPRSILVLDVDANREILFTPNRDPRFENSGRPNDFPGRPLGDDPELRRRSGIRDVRDIDEFEARMAEWVSAGRLIRVNGGRAGSLSAIATAAFPTRSIPDQFLLHLQLRHPNARVANAFAEMAGLRAVKSPVEIVAMRNAASLTAQAIAHAAGAVRPGVDERTLEAEFEAACKRGGSQRLAFGSIVKSGPNSLWPWRILAAHYDRRNRAMRAGELVILDVGCELNHYASDVGRTFPVSGRFTPDQREILRMEVAVADAIIDAVRPGVTLRELQAIADARIPEEHRPYMQTGLFFGHHVGLAVGDPNLPDTRLAPGMVFTVEPWYYNHDRGISVFTEDMVLVTADGADVLTANLPRTPEGLERLIALRR